ncbi:MAG: hypothetical protein WBM54_02870 [Woeseia sp.]
MLGQGAFDPDAVFLDDIVDDDVLPNPTLAVDGLSDAVDVRRGLLDLGAETVAANETIPGPTVIPEAVYDPEQLEVYGWESSFFMKIKGYFGF